MLRRRPHHIFRSLTHSITSEFTSPSHSIIINHSCKITFNKISRLLARRRPDDVNRTRIEITNQYLTLIGPLVCSSIPFRSTPLDGLPALALLPLSLHTKMNLSISDLWRMPLECESSCQSLSRMISSDVPPSSLSRAQRTPLPSRSLRSSSKPS